MPVSTSLQAHLAEVRDLLQRIEAAHQAAKNATTIVEFKRHLARIRDLDTGPVAASAWARGLLRDGPIFTPDPLNTRTTCVAASAEGLMFIYDGGLERRAAT